MKELFILPSNKNATHRSMIDSKKCLRLLPQALFAYRLLNKQALLELIPNQVRGLNHKTFSIPVLRF